MRAVGVACDVCDRFAKGDDPPPDWFVVYRFGSKDDEPQEVCSAGCLCKLGRQLKELDSTPAGGSAACPVPGCGRKFKGAQGLATHTARTHDKGGN